MVNMIREADFSAEKVTFLAFTQSLGIPQLKGSAGLEF
jgi:hypothetical protein